jgi:thiol:disulfide interchange protein DsbD
LSLLGLFEIRLPSFLLNKSAENEGRGGIVGVVFMALTLTITSFTCTFPVVGALLVMAARGSYFYPVLGMLAFSTVLALPFFLLALAPGLLAKMPRSGDWMNAVKVVGGLVEIGAAFKFVNTAEVGFGATPANAWFDAPVVLTIWVVMAAICGIYLLGLFRTNHDHEAVKVGPVRIISGALFLGLALYLAPALFGFPPQSKFYYTIVGILPADSHKFNSNENLIAALPRAAGMLAADVSTGAKSDAVRSADDLRPKKATSSDPKLAQREEKRLHGVLWGMSYEGALEEAKAKNRPVIIDFTGVNCANCRKMEQTVMPRPDVIAELQKFVPVQLYTDQVDIDSISEKLRKSLAEDNLDREIELIDQTTSPYYVVLNHDGKVIATSEFDDSKDGFRNFLANALKKFEGTSQARTANAPSGVKSGAVQPVEDVRPRKATSKDPKVAEREEKRLHGVLWGMSYDAAMEEAKATNRPILVAFTSIMSVSARLMEAKIIPQPEVVAELRNFLPVVQEIGVVTIDSISQEEKLKLAEDNLEREMKLTDQTTIPYYAVLNADGGVIATGGFDDSKYGFRDFLANAYKKFQESPRKVASAN